MHDRQPGAPGQYTMTIQADQLAKLLAGEACTIVLVRDDQPIAVGTPYNKASVLPDDLAASICPSVTDPTPADAFKGLLARRYVKTLPASGWSDTAPYTQTVAVDGVVSQVAFCDGFQNTGPGGGVQLHIFIDLFFLQLADLAKMYSCHKGSLPSILIRVNLTIKRFAWQSSPYIFVTMNITRPVLLCKNTPDREGRGCWLYCD